MQSRKSAESTGTETTEPENQQNCYISPQKRTGIPPITIRFPCGCLMTGMVGALAAFTMSWVFNHSIPWLVVHTTLNWLYVMYKTGWYVMTNL